MRPFLFICILLFFIASSAQDNRFGKVSEEDFKLFSESASSSNATVLFKTQNIKFDYREGAGFVQINEVHERIFIHNKEAFDWATRKIRLYNRSSSNSEDLRSLKGYTYTLENGKVEKEKLKSEGVFEEVVNKYWKYKSFTMPNVKEGCIVEFEYVIESPYSQIDDIDLQYTIPILQYELKIKTPEYYVYNKLLNPKSSFTPSIQESKVRNSIIFTDKQRSEGLRTSTSFSQSTVEFQDNVLTINASDIPALKDEPFVDNLDNYRAKLILELTAVRYPNEPVKTYSSNWDDVTKTIYDDEDFGGQLKKNGYYEEDVLRLVANKSDNMEKVNLIYEFVKSKVKWNGFVGYTAENGVRKAYKDGVGNIGDINLMLVSMIRHSGINANPVLISTKNNGIPLIPTRSGFNYIICAVEVDNTTLLLDASQKNGAVNILPVMSLNWLGRVIRNDGSSDWIGLTPTLPSKETVSLNISLNSDLSANGKVRVQYTDYQANRIRNKFENFSSDQMVENLEKDKGELQISNLETENMKDVNQPVLQSYDFSCPNAVEEIAGKLYFSPMMFLTPKENPFKENKRNFPIDFVYPIADKYMVNIMLPEGYAVETMPESTKFEFNGAEGNFSFLGRSNGNMLQFIISLDLNKPLILASEYELFKKFYQVLIEKQSEKVVLKKV